jgi:hypothetical protein
MTRFRVNWIQETLTPALAELSDALSQLDAASFPFEEAQGLRGAIQTVQRLQRESRALTIQEATSRRGFESLSPTLEAAVTAAQTQSEATTSAEDAVADGAIDFAGLTERCLDDQSFLRNLMTSFRAQLDADLREAELLHLGRQWTPLSLLAGRALGTAENMAARQLSEAWRLCHAGANNQSAEETEAAVTLLQIATTRTTLAIDQWLMRHQPCSVTPRVRREEHADSRR